MAPRRRRSVLKLGGSVLVASLGGCVGNISEEPDNEESPDDSTEGGDGATADGGDPTEGNETSTDDSEHSNESDENTDDDGEESGDSGLAEKTNQPNPDHPIRVDNFYNEAQTVTLTITQNETVVENLTREVDAGADIVPYNLRELDPDGIEEYTITAQVNDGTESVTVKTNDCFGDVNVNIQSDGTLFVRFAIC